MLSIHMVTKTFISSCLDKHEAYWTCLFLFSMKANQYSMSYQLSNKVIQKSNKKRNAKKLFQRISCK